VSHLLLHGLEDGGLLPHGRIEVVAMHVHIQMTVFTPGQFLGGQRSEHAGGPFGLFAMLVIRVLTSRGASEDHGVPPVVSMGSEFSDEPSKSNRPYLI